MSGERPADAVEPRPADATERRPGDASERRSGVATERRTANACSEQPIRTDGGGENTSDASESADDASDEDGSIQSDGADQDDDGDVTDELDVDLDDLVERAETATEGIQDGLDDPDFDLEELPDLLEEDESDETLGYVRDLLEVADEAEDVLETVDLTELVEAVEYDDVDELVDLDELPEAFGDGEVTDVVKVRKLLQVLDLSDVWDAANVRQFWDERDELTDAVDDVTEDEVDDEGDGAGEDDSMMDLGLGDEDEEMVEDVDFEMPEFDGIHDYDPRTIENAVQMKAMEGIEGIRAALIEAHQKVSRLREENRHRLPEQDRQTHSRNPTAVSLLPKRERDDFGNSTRYSTVPRETRYSTAPNFRRIYGNRFKEETDDERN